MSIFSLPTSPNDNSLSVYVADEQLHVEHEALREEDGTINNHQPVECCQSNVDMDSMYSVGDKILSSTPQMKDLNANVAGELYKYGIPAIAVTDADGCLVEESFETAPQPDSDTNPAFGPKELYTTSTNAAVVMDMVSVCLLCCYVQSLLG